MNAWSRPLLAAVGVVIADQVSKLLATSWTPSLIGTLAWRRGMLSIVPVENGDAIGGLDVGRPELLPAAAVVALIVLLALSRRLTAGSTLGAALALGGSAGNLFDRVRIGHVIDFLALHLGPAQVVLNVADIALFIGIPLLLIVARREDGDANVGRNGEDARFASSGLGGS